MRYSGTFVVLCVALSSGAATVASAQQNRLTTGLDDRTRTEVLRTVETAREQGLPVDPLLDKALEGVTKRAPGDRIEAAVVALLRRLETSRDALAPAATQADITAGADALAAGVPTNTLRDIRAFSPGRPIAVPLAVLAQLVAQGVPVSRASEMVQTLLRRGVREEQLIALNSAVQSDIAAGVSPAAALDVRTRGLTAVLPPLPGAAAAGAASALGAASNPPRK